MKQYTVIGYYENDGLRFVHHVEADYPEAAVTAAIKYVRGESGGETDLVIVEVIDGHHNGQLEGDNIWDANDCDWDDPAIAIGDQVQNIENMWQGRVTAFEQQDGCTMLVCHHVTYGGEIELDDKRWFDPRDVRLIRKGNT